MYNSIQVVYITYIHMLFDICFYNIMQLYVVVTLAILVDITWLIPVWRMIIALIMTSCGGSVQLPGMQINALTKQEMFTMLRQWPKWCENGPTGWNEFHQFRGKVNMIV